MSIHPYGLSISVGFLISFFLIYLDKKRRAAYNLSFDFLTNSASVITTGAILGARIWYVFFDTSFPSFSVLELLCFSDGGLSLIGGLIGGMLFAWITCRMHSYSIFSLFNFIAPYLCLINAFGRIGCYFSPCCGGMLLSPIEIPIQFVSSFHYFCYFIIFFVWRKRLDSSNEPFFFLYPAIIFLERILLDSFRYDHIIWIQGWTKYQAIGFLGISITFVIFLLIPLCTKRKKT
jgi:phosphatidylglycerol:prolipoprotein diacylglycerol transferase